jgi:transposase-like protein
MLSPKQRKAVELLAEGDQSRKEIAKSVGVHPKTLNRWLKEPEFLKAYHEAFQIRQCQDLQNLHQVVQGAYKEIFKRFSEEQLSEVPIQQLVQMLDRLNKQIESISTQLGRMNDKKSTVEDTAPLLSEEEYHELAQAVLGKIAQGRAPGS